jgi:hypothetical protein
MAGAPSDAAPHRASPEAAALLVLLSHTYWHKVTTESLRRLKQTCPYDVVSPLVSSKRNAGIIIKRKPNTTPVASNAFDDDAHILTVRFATLGRHALESLWDNFPRRRCRGEEIPIASL